ncbi:unnamed protein product [Parajaminaea phylloscopi]
MPAASRHARRIQSAAGVKLIVRGQSTDELLKKVKSIQTELAAAESDIDLGSLKDLNPQLCSHQLTLHKDQAVRASVACCLADVLRIFAPDAPFSEKQLKDIIQFFLLELKAPKSGISNPSGPQYSDYYALLDNLSRVKTLALIADLSNAEELMVDWFRGVFGLISPHMTKNVELSLADVLAQLVDECPQIPHEVLELLLDNLSHKTSKLNPAAQNLAVHICTATSDRLQSHVAQYFSESIVAASSEDEAEEKEKELRRYHSLIRDIHRQVPTLLLNVIAILEQELSAEDVIVRQIAVQTLGQMLSDKSATPLATNYPNTWKAWLGRARDKVPSLRAFWVESVGTLLVNQPQLRADITPVISEKLIDPDEKVRIGLIRILGGLDYETALHHLDLSLLRDLSNRLLDRRSPVRSEAQLALGRLYGLAYPEIESHDSAATKQFAWIPNALLGASYTDSKTTPILIAAFEKHILPLPAQTSDEAAWVNRLLLVMKHLDERGVKALFLRLNNMQALHSRKPYLPFIDSCEKYNGGVVEGNEEQVKKTLSAAIRGSVTMMADPEKAMQDLMTFARLNDSRIFRLVKVSLLPTTDLKTYLKARAEALRRIEASDAKLLPTMKRFLRLSSYPFINSNSVPTLLKRLTLNRSQWRESQIGVDSQAEASTSVKPESDGLASLADADAFRHCAARALSFLSKQCPEMYEPHVLDLLRSLTEDGTPQLLEEALRALCAVKALGRPVSLDKRVADRIARLTLSGSPLQAKFGARLLALSSETPTVMRKIDELLSEISGRLAKDDPARLVTDLNALGQFFKYAPKASENVWDSVVRDILRDLGQAWPEGAAESYEPDDDWVEDSSMDDSVKAKLLGLDVLCKRSIAATGDAENAADMTEPVFRLMWRTLETGEPRELGTPAPVKSRLRLKAALCVLKMALLPACDQLIDRNFVSLALVVQDACFHVRSLFLHKLLLYLNGAGGGSKKRRKLTNRYSAIPYMAAMDPESENREMVKTWAARLKSLPNEERIKRVELTLCRYVHLLSHHPDFSRADDSSILEFVPYVQFFLACTATERNVGLLFYLAGRLKTVRDGVSQGASENLYTLSEMTQLIIKHKATKNGWRLDQFPGTFKVPMDTGLRALPSPQARKEIYETVWLPSTASATLEHDINRAERKARPAAATSTGSGQKRAATSTSKKSRKKAQRSSPTKKRRLADGNSDDASAVDTDSEEASEAEDDAISSDEEVSEGEEEGRGARTKAQAKERNRKRAQRREALAAKASENGQNPARAPLTGGDDEDSELSDIE